MLVPMVSVQRHLAVLRSMLQPGEGERLWIRAERAEKSHSGALLLTDRRLLFSGLGFVSQSQEAWPLTIVSGVRTTPAGLELRALGAPETFTGKPDDLERMAALLPTTTVVDVSVTDELERLVRLRDSGALTPAEFEGAKRRLLE
jgi:hypothetical protein